MVDFIERHAEKIAGVLPCLDKRKRATHLSREQKQQHDYTHSAKQSALLGR